MSKNLEQNELIARWLSGDLTSEEKKELDNSGQLDALKVVLDDVSTWSVEKFDVEKGLSKLKAKQPKKQQIKIIQWNKLFKIAAVITLLIVAYLNKDTILGNGKIELITGIGETLNHELPDGSMVTLDAVSTLSYHKKNWEENRSLILEGQAYFEVEKGSRFTVNTALGNVEVLGTQFNVKAINRNFSVFCYEGKVRVESGDEEMILTANQGLETVKGQLKLLKKMPKRSDWKAGFNEYNQVALSEVIEDLKRYYSVKIDLPVKYTNLRFTGKVTHSNLEKALRSIFIPMEIAYKLDEENIVVFD